MTFGDRAKSISQFVAALGWTLFCATLSKAQEATPIDQQVAILRREIELNAKFQTDLLATVYWSLGTMGAVSIAMLAFASFFNLRLSSKELEALKSELKSSVGTEVAKVSEGFAAAEKKREEKVNELKASVNSRITKAVKASNASIEEEVFDVKLDVLQLQVFRHVVEEVPLNEASAWRELAELALAVGYDWKVDEGLNRIGEIFEQGSIPSSLQVGEYITLLNSLPDSRYGPQKRRILRLLEAPSS